MVLNMEKVKKINLNQALKENIKGESDPEAAQDSVDGGVDCQCVTFTCDWFIFGFVTVIQRYKTTNQGPNYLKSWLLSLIPNDALGWWTARPTNSKCQCWTTRETLSIGGLTSREWRQTFNFIRHWMFNTGTCICKQSALHSSISEAVHFYVM